MSLPISYAEMDVIVEKEVDTTITFTNNVNEGAVTLDNNGNTRQTPKIEITANGAITDLTITNTTLSCSIQIGTDLVADDIILIDDYIVYKNGVEIDAIFNAPFELKENSDNVIEFTIVGGSSIDADFTWKQPSGVQSVQLYTQRFSLTETKTFQRKPGNFKSPYNRGSKFKSGDYQYSLERFWYNGDFFDNSNETTYRITYQTDDDIAESDLTRKTYCLCGCAIESHQVSQQDNQVISETISGSADRRFEISYPG
jgi:hypothetical protein